MFREGAQNRFETVAKKDYYEILRVGKNATGPEIRSAFAKIAKKTHPDLNPGDKSAEEAFKTASEAYNVLSEPKQRATYDRFGFNGEPEGFEDGRGDFYAGPNRERQNPGQLKPKRDKNGIHLEDAFGRKVSDNFLELVNIEGIFVARYSDGAYCIVDEETGKTTTRGYKRIEVRQDFVIGTLNSGKKVLVNFKSGRESGEFWNIKIKDNKAFGKSGLFKYQEIRIPY